MPKKGAEKSERNTAKRAKEILQKERKKYGKKSERNTAKRAKEILQKEREKKYCKKSERNTAKRANEILQNERKKYCITLFAAPPRVIPVIAGHNLCSIYNQCLASKILNKVQNSCNKHDKGAFILGS